ncbi:unnamed protein product [Gordionus sp. m RMFG-2023]
MDGKSLSDYFDLYKETAVRIFTKGLVNMNMDDKLMNDIMAEFEKLFTRNLHYEYDKIGHNMDAKLSNDSHLSIKIEFERSKVELSKMLNKIHNQRNMVSKLCPEYKQKELKYASESIHNMSLNTPEFEDTYRDDEFFNSLNTEFL